MNPKSQDNLENLINRAVRDLPSRRAPEALEQRVQAEIARRAALPWWRKSFVYWPVAARAGFVATSCALVALYFTGFGWITSGLGAAQLRTTFAAEAQWLRLVRNLLEAGIQSADAIVGSISPLWLYGGAVIVAALYAALFGLGAAAYRTLYASR